MRLNLPPLARSLLIALVGLTLLNSLLADGSTPLSFFTRIGHGWRFLSLVPLQVWRAPWTFLTATAVEQNIFGLLVTGGTLLFGGRYLERAWDSTEFAKFMLLICVAPNVIVWAVYTFLWLLSGSGKAGDTTISGGIAVQIAYLVAFKQLVPEHTVSILRGVVRARVKHFPAVFLLANTLSGILLGTETAMFLSWGSFLVSWSYLRFIKVSPITATENGSTIKGDASDTFAFAYFFPEAIQGPISTVADAIYNVLVAVGVCTRFSADDVDEANEQAIARAEGGLPSIMTARGSGRREQAERRRALALKALDQRLHAQTTRGVSGTSSGPATTTVTIPAPTDAIDDIKAAAPAEAAAS